MSLKSVEIQMAIPRTKDAGMLQNQLSHKPMQDQAALASGSIQQSQKLRQKAAKLEESVPMKVKDESTEQRKKQLKSPYAGSKSAAKKTTEENVEHPYKGHHIDLSL
ncbi:MAG: hypothetical protein K0Q81_1962 [Paenibacillus sp.]|jgi:hypothetical protein|nr:hypothetical protein [Paenibacillus sp.]